jgi:hypothetical protein
VYLVEVNCHKNSGLASPQCQQKVVQVKSGLAPTGVFRQSWYYTAVPVANIRRVVVKNKSAKGKIQAFAGILSDQSVVTIRV